MGLISKFLHKTPTQKLVVTPDGRSKIPVSIRAASVLTRRTSVGEEGQLPKRGMWVAYADPTGTRIGILTDLTVGDIATVALVDGAGLNLLVITCMAASLRQAFLEEIPLQRRHIDESHFLALGYTRAPA